MDIIPIKALKDNYIWTVTTKPSQEVIIVDPGEAIPVIETLQHLNLNLGAILITHHHWDHTNGIQELLNYFGKLPVVGSSLSQNPFINQRVSDHNPFSFSNISFNALEIPGHTLDHTAYWIADKHILFTGDTLFSAGCGRIFEGTPEMMYNTLNKIAALPDKTQIYCGHEYTAANLRFAKAVEPENTAIDTKIVSLSECTLPSTLADEKSFNPFLRCHLSSVKLAAEKFMGKSLNTPLEVFTAIREWKNHANF